MINIYEYAKQRVSNKGVAARIKHSPKLHALRSALSSKGSFASKGAGVITMGVRLAIAQIPIPSIVTDLFSVAQQAVEKKIRSHMHTHRSGPMSQEDTVKFTLKELTVEELDRYRWKLKDAIVELNKKVQNLPTTYETKFKEARPCDALLEVAEALAQAERRFTILNQSAEIMKQAMLECQKWAEVQKDAINKFKESQSQVFANIIKDEEAEADKQEAKQKGSGETTLNSWHVNCENYCYVKQVSEMENEAWTKIKVKLAMITKSVASPIDLESFVSTTGDQYAMPGD